jgi:hypothetical protein
MLMINSESIISGICLAVIITQCLGYYIVESKPLSFVLYCFVGIWIYGVITKKKKVTEGYLEKDRIQFKDFEASESFEGKRDGYVFKNDIKGQGYYLDNKN